jgi:PAS domain S-box-containing protein
VRYERAVIAASPQGAAHRAAGSWPSPVVPGPAWVRAGALAVAYVAFAAVGRWSAPAPGAFAVLWPPAGLVVAVLLLGATRAWPWVCATAFAAQVASGVGEGRALSFMLAAAAASTAQAALGALLVRRLVAERPTLGDVREVVGVAAYGAGAVAIVGGAATALLGRWSGAPVTAWAAWWAADVLGVLVAAPLALTWVDVDGDRLAVRAPARALELAVLLATMCAFVFASLRVGGRPHLSRLVFAMPWLLWAALRFEGRGAAMAGALATVAAAAALHGHARGVLGPAVAFQLQAQLAVMVISSLVLAAAVAARRRALGQARDNEDLVREFLRHAPALLFVKDARSRALLVSDAFVEVSGVPAAELVGRPLAEVFPPDVAEQMRRDDERVLAERRPLEFTYEVRGRALATVEFPIVRGGRPPLIGGFAQDVTERRAAVVSDRLTSLGTLAAGVAHEINNPLAFVLSNVAFAREHLADAELRGDVEEALAQSEAGAARVRDIVRDLRAFARPPEGPRAPVDPRGPLRTALAMARNEIRHRARLVLDLADVPPVDGEEHRLAQVFLNLLINAAQAIPEGRAADHEIAVRTRLREGRVEVDISDTGSGIAPEVRPRVFEPFFTTKPVGSGTGLGLSICHGIVTSLGGTIDVASAPGRGTTFTVALPAATRPPEAPAPSAPPPPRPARRRVLVVDDEPLVAKAVARMLQGHDVTVAGDAAAVLRRVAAGERYDVLVCDLMMPDMSGAELHARLREAAPELARHTLFMTGGAFTADARRFLAETACPHLEKPFDAAALRSAIEERARG